MFVIIAAIILIVINFMSISVKAKNILITIGFGCLAIQFFYWWIKYRRNSLMLQEALMLTDAKNTRYFVNHIEQDSKFDLIEFLAKHKGHYTLVVEYEETPEVHIRLR